MTDEVILILILANGILSLLYFIWAAKKSKSQAISEVAMMLLIPFFGPGFILIIKLAEVFKLKQEDPSYMYQEFKNKHLILGDFMQHEANIIPINDALFIDDTNTKRTLLTDAIKQNVLQNNNILLKVVRDSDREVSHYAVSMVTNIIGNLEVILFQLEKKLLEDPKNIECLMKYADAMSEYLQIGFLDPISQKKSEEIYINILENIISLKVTDKRYFIEKINYEIKQENYKKAEFDCRNFMDIFPNDEDPYLMYIKLYGQLNEYQKMQEKLQELKACPIKFTRNALEIIRFWGGEEEYV